MALEDILDLTERNLKKEGVPVPKGFMDAFRQYGSLPESVLVRRGFGVDDDLATALVLSDQIELEELRARAGKTAGSILRHPKPLLDAWGMCETLRRLGFPPDSLAVGWGTVPGQGDDVLHVRIERGGKSMTVCVARVSADSPEEAMRGWSELWEDVMKAGEDELCVALARSSMGDYLKLVALVRELERQEMGIPAMRAPTSPPRRDQLM